MCAEMGDLRDCFMVPDDAVVVEIFSWIKPETDSLLPIADTSSKNVSLKDDFVVSGLGVGLVAEEFKVDFAMVGSR